MSNLERLDYSYYTFCTTRGQRARASHLLSFNLYLCWFVYHDSYYGGLVTLADLDQSDGTCMYNRYGTGCQGFMAT